MNTTLERTNPKNTTQSALLENFLAIQRTAKAIPYLRNRNVLDFGCGEHLWTIRAISKHVSSVCGYDILYQGLPKQISHDGFSIYGELDQIDTSVDCIVSLACFEHIDPELLPEILKKLHSLSGPSATIVGTVPRPSAKPILEFLSYKLGLIDEKQIRDHKIYYNKLTLQTVAQLGGWKLSHYKTFQFGLNSFFIFNK